MVCLSPRTLLQTSRTLLIQQVYLARQIIHLPLEEGMAFSPVYIYVYKAVYKAVSNNGCSYECCLPIRFFDGAVPTFVTIFVTFLSSVLYIFSDLAYGRENVMN